MLLSKILSFFCNTNQFPSFPLCGTHKKPHGVRGLTNNYHIIFDPKLGNGICSIHHIPYSCAECTSILDKPWIRGLTPQQQPRCQPVTDCTYWPVIGSFNNWNIITFSHKATIIEAFGEIYKFILDGISYHMASLVQPCRYGAMNTTDTSTVGYYVIKFVSEEYNL